MSITVKRTVPQISLIPYGSPGFDEVISTLGVTPTLGRGNQYLVGIKIGTIPHPITEVWLLYEVTDGGTVVQDVWCLAPGRLRTGDAYVDAPAPWHQMAEGLMARAEPKYIDVPIPPMPADKLAGKRIRASVDAVVYDDGTFSGPDTLNLFAQLSSKDQQIREFLNSLADQLSSGTPDEEIEAWLESRAR